MQVVRIAERGTVEEDNRGQLSVSYLLLVTRKNGYT